MDNMQHWKRPLLIVLLVAATVMLFLATQLPPGKCLVTAGLITALAAILQAEISGVFEWLWKIYGDDREYPFGPPPHITRNVIANPDSPTQETIRSYLFFSPTAAVHLLIASIILQIAGAWL